MPQEQIVSLPLNGRSVLQLIVLSGSAVETPGLTDNRQYPNSVAISVAGGTGNSTMYLVDGGYNNDPQNNTGNPMPFPDALQEFKTENGVRNARYGMSTGATVNAVTKSGGNTLHGSVFDFVRDSRFNAIRYFEKKENGGLGRDDGLRRNQIGGTLGGPLLKDKLFFFGGTQITNTRIAPTGRRSDRPDRGSAARRLHAHHVGGVPRRHGPHARRAVRQQPDRPGAVPSHRGEDDEHAAAARSGARSRRVRPLRAADPERQRRAAVHRPPGLPDDAEQARLRPRRSTPSTCTHPGSTRAIRTC